MDKLIQLHSLEEFKEAIQNKCIIVFSTDWCPDCLYMKTYIEHVVENNPGIPSFIAYDKGQELGRLVSKLRKTEEEVQSFIDSI